MKINIYVRNHKQMHKQQSKHVIFSTLHQTKRHNLSDVNRSDVTIYVNKKIYVRTTKKHEASPPHTYISLYKVGIEGL